MEADRLNKREELVETCYDLRLPVSGNEDLETLEFYILAAYDDLNDKNTSNKSTSQEEPQAEIQDIDYGTIGDKSWRVKYYLNKILFFL